MERKCVLFFECVGKFSGMNSIISNCTGNVPSRTPETRCANVKLSKSLCHQKASATTEFLILWFGKTSANGSEAIPAMSQECSAERVKVEEGGKKRKLKRSRRDAYSNKLHSWPAHTSHVVTSWQRFSPPLQMLSHF